MERHALRDDQFARIEIEVEAAEPHRITKMDLRAGGRRLAHSTIVVVLPDPATATMTAEPSLRSTKSKIRF